MDKLCLDKQEGVSSSTLGAVASEIMCFSLWCPHIPKAQKGENAARQGLGRAVRRTRHDLPTLQHRRHHFILLFSVTVKIDSLSPENRNVDSEHPHVDRCGTATTMFVVLSHSIPD